MSSFKVFNFRNFDPAARHAVVTIGNFDGVHLGHQALIRRVVEEARVLHAAGILLTFDPHPQTVLRQHPVALLSSLPMRLRLFDQLGLDAACIINFTPEFARMSAQAFVDEYLFARFQVRKLIIGYDFAFGHNRAGTAEVLLQLSRTHDFMFEVFPALKVGQDTVGSSVIRALLGGGDFAAAARLLGRAYSVLEPVAAGEQRGRTLGVPTINQAPQAPLPIAGGVYAVHAIVGEQMLGGVSNYGVRPTVGGQTALLETHLFDFSGDLYGQTVEVIPRVHLRPERKFPSLEALKAQIVLDQEQARHALTQWGPPGT
jgi:riboflavin kinase/FMN adenylyltransferase